MALGPLRKIVVVGSDVAAWMSAALLGHMLKDRCTIQVIDADSSSAPMEAHAGTLPRLKELHAILGIDEPDLMTKTHATFRLGGAFRDWGSIGESYFHPFGDIGANLESISFRHHWLKQRRLGDASALTDFSLCATAARLGHFARPSTDRRSVLSTLDYGYHLDTALYADYLRSHALSIGVRHGNALFTDAIRAPDGSISALAVSGGGEPVEGDLFIDATGAGGLLIEGVLHSGFEDWSEWLPTDRTIAVTVEPDANLVPYSTSRATGWGWQWTVPLRQCTGAGSAYCSRFVTDDDAAASLLSGLTPLSEPKLAKIVNGRRRQFWSQNVIAIGAAACSLEPLEAVNIHLIQSGLMRLLALLPGCVTAKNERAEYNRLMESETERIRDFLVLHYAATGRNDTPFWDQCRTMPLPQTMERKLELFRSRGNVVLYDEETFGEQDWVSVFIGQNIIPARYDPLADAVDPEQIRMQLQRMRSVIRQGADSMPPHRVFLEKFLRASGR